MKSGKQVQEQVEKFASSLLGGFREFGKKVDRALQDKFSLQARVEQVYQGFIKVGFASKEARRMVVKLVNQAMDKAGKEGS